MIFIDQYHLNLKLKPSLFFTRNDVCLRNDCRNSILMTRHYPDLGGAFDWLKQISLTTQPIRNTTQIWVMTRHQYGISALVSQRSFGGESSGSVTKSPKVSCFLNLLFLFCNGFPAKSCVRKEGRNSILMTWITTQFWAVLPIG